MNHDISKSRRLRSGEGLCTVQPSEAASQRTARTSICGSLVSNTLVGNIDAHRGEGMIAFLPARGAGLVGFGPESGSQDPKRDGSQLDLREGGPMFETTLHAPPVCADASADSFALRADVFVSGKYRPVSTG